MWLHNHCTGWSWETDSYDEMVKARCTKCSLRFDEIYECCDFVSCDVGGAVVT